LYTVDGYLVTKAKEQLAEAAFRHLKKQLAHIHSECDPLMRSSANHRQELVRICTSSGVSSEIAESLVSDLIFGQRGIAPVLVPQRLSA
jgi:hypothetical protein